MKDIKGYEYIDELGRGGEARVFKYRNQQTGVEHALKFYNRGQGLHEANQLYKLDHPNIVTLIDKIEDGDDIILVLELAKRSLRQELESNDASIPNLAKYFECVVSGLEYIHSQNMVHRDLKPDNILIFDDGVAKISDFGLVKDLNTEQSIITTDQVVGTPGYRSPKQDKDSKHVGPEDDLYALVETTIKIVQHIVSGNKHRQEFYKSHAVFDTIANGRQHYEDLDLQEFKLIVLDFLSDVSSSLDLKFPVSLWHMVVDGELTLYLDQSCTKPDPLYQGVFLEQSSFGLMSHRVIATRNKSLNLKNGDYIKFKSIEPGLNERWYVCPKTHNHHLAWSRAATTDITVLASGEEPISHDSLSILPPNSLPFNKNSLVHFQVIASGSIGSMKIRQNVTEHVTWSNGGSDLVEIKDNVVTFNGPGKARLQATYGAIQESVSIDFDDLKMGGYSLISDGIRGIRRLCVSRDNEFFIVDGSSHIKFFSRHHKLSNWITESTDLTSPFALVDLDYASGVLVSANMRNGTISTYCKHNNNMIKSTKEDGYVSLVSISNDGKVAFTKRGDILCLTDSNLSSVKSQRLSFRPAVIKCTKSCIICADNQHDELWFFSHEFKILGKVSVKNDTTSSIFSLCVDCEDEETIRVFVGFFHNGCVMRYSIDGFSSLVSERLVLENINDAISGISKGTDDNLYVSTFSDGKIYCVSI